MTAEPSWIIGSAPDCDVRVDSPTVSGRHCRLTQRGKLFLLEDLQSTNGTYVNGERADGPRMVRRGDRVTLGHDTPLPWPNVPISITVGRSPDCNVVIPHDAVSGQHARVQKEGNQAFLIDLGSTNGTAINDPLNKITRAPLNASDSVFLGSHRVAAADLLAALPAPALDFATMVERGRRDEPAGGGAPQERASANLNWAAFRSPRSWALGALLSLLVVAVVVGAANLLGRRGVSTGEATYVASEPADDSPPVTEPQLAPVPSRAPEPPREKVADADQRAGPADEPTVDSQPPKDPWDEALDELRKAVFLLAIEEPEKQRTWPAATACAIGENTLLTTGRMVTGLAAVRQQGWKLWAINEPLGLQVEIDSLRVHVGYASSAGQPTEQIFFDLGLVDVAEKLSSVARLAGRDELAELEPGFPLGCIGIEYQEKAPLFRFQSNTAELTRAKVLEIAPLEAPSAPSLLIFGADLPSKQYGAAMINEQGKVCAVFAEVAETDGTGPKMHYAPLIDRALILDHASTGRDVWVEPVVPEAEKKP